MTSSPSAYTLTLDHQTHDVEHGVRLLDWLKIQGVQVPALCQHNSNGPKTACDLCVVEVDGQLQRSCEVRVNRELVIVSESDAITAHRQAALKRILKDHTADCDAPCQTACPAEVDVQSYLHHIAAGEPVQANAVIKQTLPMSLSIGRVCPAFCERDCRRSLVDEPLAIRQLKRHAADCDLAQETPVLAPIAPSTGKRVAIIGAGPAGLSAGYFLSHAGVAVDIFEAADEPGGWLRYGIPEYRLPKAILAKEIALMCRAGMQIHTGLKLGRDLELAQLSQQYDAVCLAVGAQKAVALDYPGSELDGMLLGVDYLRAANAGQPTALGKRVAVIGGGNTAIDCARTALRQGAEVTLVYRRTKAEMPAEDYEIHEAEVEGVNFLFLANPVENRADDDGRIAQVGFETLQLGPEDASGRRRPEPTGEVQWHAFDTVIAAVSQQTQIDFVPEGSLPLTRWRTADACPDTFRLGEDGLFAIGDFRLGPATAVEAIGDGRRCAEAMLDYFRQGEFQPRQPGYNARKAKTLAEVEVRCFEGVTPAPRSIMPEQAIGERTSRFSEVELGFSVDDAIAEAARCLACGCQKSQACGLRDAASLYRIKDADLDKRWSPQRPVDDSSPFIRFDPNRCIRCGACVEACQNQGVHNVLNFADGECQQPVRIGDGTLMANSACVQCGLCVQACPVGALTEKTLNQYGARPALKTVDTLCTYCGVGCGLTLHVDEVKNRVVKITGNEASPVNQGMLCVKGRFGFDFLHSPERLTQPLVRKAGQLVPVSWEEALVTLAERLGAIKAKHGGNALAGLSSAKTTNEENFLFQKFVRTLLGSNNVDHCARLCHATTVTGLEPAIGSGAMTNDLATLDQADLIVLIGSDTSNAHPIIASRIKQAVKQGKIRLVVVDPRRIDMAEHAELVVNQRSGTDVMLINAVMQQILVNNWQDEAYIAARTQGFDGLKSEVMREEYGLDNAATLTGVPAEKIAQLARLIGTSGRTAVYYAMGITQHSNGTNNVRSLANLQLLCGNIGVTGGGINPLRGQSNVQGACDMGALPNYLPGYQKIGEADNLERFEAFWQQSLPTQPGLKLTEMIDAMGSGALKGLYIMGENPVLSDPDQQHVLSALAKLDCLVVQDLFLTETAQLADIVLPAAAFAEKSGHFTNTERRVQRLNPALKPPGEALPDWAIIQKVAQAMGADWDYRAPSDITAEICQVTPSYRGITWARAAAGELQWPCPSEQHPGTPILHQAQFIRRQKAQFAAVPHRLSAEAPCEAYPLILSTGRQLAQFHTGTLTRKTQGLDQMAPPQVMVSIEDGEALGIRNDTQVTVTTRRGALTLPARLSKQVPKGMLFLPFHFTESPANVLTHAALDPYAKIPEFKVAAARLEVA
ncbi:formate dehydrogenase subunit alpha [Ferrimonas gelatinilytica]|uniref:Formate dehydrogenase subunit alpha n=1 Tax=Ferrimonas gelatinilytica TaxID=1255257 RepID=A0ABP9RWE6_9GAMM